MLKRWTIRDFINPVTVQRYQNIVSAVFPVSPSRKQGTVQTGCHLLFFHPVTQDLSPDGYYAYQTPDKLLGTAYGFKRRMWVQGSIEFKRPLQNSWYTCEENLKFVKTLKKDHFVALNRVVRGSDEQECINEQRMLIYSNQPVSDTSGDSGTGKHREFTHLSTTTITDMAIMIYSSLSCNPHRIHWDRDYCRNVEGYQDIIVQGPFLVQLVLNYFEYHFQRPVSYIKYKNTSHIYAGTQVQICHDRPDNEGKVKLIIRDYRRPNLEYFQCSVS